MSLYDVGIVGCWYWGNYGSILNGYATFNLVKNLGYKPLNIITPYNGFEPHAKAFFAKAYGEGDISKTYTFEELNGLNEICDMFLTGSDQIWNYTPYKPDRAYDKYFRLSFVEDGHKRISLSTSLGNYIEEKEEDCKTFKALYQKYNAISVREKSAVDIFKNKYGINAFNSLEPVLAIDTDEWKRLAELSQYRENGKYLLTYILDPTEEKKNAINFYQKESGLELRNILDGFSGIYEANKEKLGLPNSLPNINSMDFLYYFMNADFVITDSFHGMCFSLIFNKPFLVINNPQRGNERFNSILTKVGLLDRLVPFDNIALDKKFLEKLDYSEINKTIRGEADKTISWLEKQLSTSIDKMKPIVVSKLSVEEVVESDRCAGCSSCSNDCPVNAITMTKNENGFNVPSINKEKCIECGRCRKVCPILSYKVNDNATPKCHAVMANDDIRKKSSSGGFFLLAAKEMLKQGGYVCGVLFDDKFNAYHKITNDIDVVHKMCGSKYLQSYVGNTFTEIKKLMDDGKKVLFTGLPCQVAGLKLFLKDNYENLVTIDIFCHGITSQKVFNRYLEDVHQNKEMTDIKFKEKEPWGWHAGINAYYADGSKYEQPLETDPYYIAYLSSLSKNRICGECKFAAIDRPGDLSIGDFWGIWKHKASLNDGLGTSAVLINSEKGNTFFSELSEEIKVNEEAPLDIARGNNLILNRPYVNHRYRKLFFDNLDKMKFTLLTDRLKSNSAFDVLNLTNTFPEESRDMYDLAKIVFDNYRGRKIVTWIQSDLFERILFEMYGLSVDHYVAKRNEVVDNEKTFHFDSLRNGQNDFYLVSLDAPGSMDNDKTLRGMGYEPVKDYVYRIPKRLVFDNYSLVNPYFDDCGNIIEGFEGNVGHLDLNGRNIRIRVGRNVKGLSNLKIIAASNTSIYIDDNCVFHDQITIECPDSIGYANLRIGKSCQFSSTLVRIMKSYQRTEVRINDFATFGRNFEIHANQGKKVIIGKDCMFSYNIQLWAGDAHSIFDVETGKNINCDSSSISSVRKTLSIGNHVWVGTNSMIMHGTVIGDGSIVGAMSVVKGRFSNNVSVAGNPGRLVKENIAWSRHEYLESIDVNSEYCRKTDESDLGGICNKKVLVVGGTHFMGSGLVDELLSRGNDVTLFNRGITKDSWGSQVRRITGNIKSAEIESLLNHEHYDVVFNNLAYCSNHVFNVLENITCDRYVQLSTIGVYENYKLDMDEDYWIPTTGDYEMCFEAEDYETGKRYSERILAQKYNDINSIVVRIPYVSPTIRIEQLCRAISTGTTIKGKNIDTEFNFVTATEVSKFLVWISSKDIKGAINYGCSGTVKMRDLIQYIEEKIGKKAIISAFEGWKMPFDEVPYSMDYSNLEELNYPIRDVDSWFWKMVDGVINRVNK